MKKSPDTKISGHLYKEYSYDTDYDNLDYADISEPLYKYCSCDTALEIIQNRKIRLSIKSEFNDPFDVAPVVKFGTSATNLTTDKMDSKFDEIKIYCLTENANNILMWSHYANNHTGVCLEFVNHHVFEQDKEEYNMSPYKVRYVSLEERPILDLSSLLPSEQVYEKITEILNTKYDIWQYEKEWRAILLYKDNYSHLKCLEDPKADISSTAIKSCTFGCRVTDKDRQEFMKECGNKGLNIQFKQARMHRKHYALEYKAIL